MGKQVVVSSELIDAILTSHGIELARLPVYWLLVAYRGKVAYDAPRTSNTIKLFSIYFSTNWLIAHAQAHAQAHVAAYDVRYLLL